ncbi:MAG: DUF3035 domain-containing protein [Rubrimonas sp.]|uniref:DUF3035 domain-containing protein n=1 Tax=Rubrimonas sp. TaxID=2036015 RepID=UPI002FDD85A2
MRSRPYLGAALAAAVATASGCTVGSADGLGLRPAPPDEFLVVERRPLERPSNMMSLPLPRPGARSPLEPDPQRDAQAALAGPVAAATDGTAPVGAAREGAAPEGAARADAPPATPAQQSAAEQALVAGAGPADPAIRETLAQEVFVPERRFGLDSLFGVKIVQDPRDEARRVQPTPESERLLTEGLPAPVRPPEPPAE